MITVTTNAVRTTAIAIVWVVWTLIMVVNIPEAGATDTRAFGGWAILWMICTMIGGMAAIITLWQYFWDRAGDIADWLNARLPL